MPITQARLSELLSAAEELARTLQQTCSAAQGLITIHQANLPVEFIEQLEQVVARPDLLVASQLQLLAIERMRYRATHRRNLTEARYRAKRRLRQSPATSQQRDTEAAITRLTHLNNPAPSQITTLISDGELCSPDGAILPAGTRVDILPSGRWFISPAEDQASPSPEDELDAALRGTQP